MPRGGSERFARFPVREDRRPFAWLRACVVHIGPPDQFAPTAPLLPYFFAGYADRRSASMVFSVHGGEHALVVRRRHAVRAAHHEGYGAVVRDSVCFLEGVDLLSGQRRQHCSCANRGRTAAAHLVSRDDVGREHRKDAQHSCQPKLRKLWGYQTSLRVFVPCHGRDYTRVQRPVDCGARYPTNRCASGLRSRAKISGRPANSRGAIPHSYARTSTPSFPLLVRRDDGASSDRRDGRCAPP